MLWYMLTRDELAELTGYKQGARQAAWLAGNKIPFKMGVDGRPRVLRTDYLLCMRSTAPAESITYSTRASAEDRATIARGLRLLALKRR